VDSLDNTTQLSRSGPKREPVTNDSAALRAEKANIPGMIPQANFFVKMLQDSLSSFEGKQQFVCPGCCILCCNLAQK